MNTPHEASLGTSLAERSPLTEDVVAAEVRGHQCLVYRSRPRNVTELMREGRRWRHRTFIVHGVRRYTYAEHERAVQRSAAMLAELGIRRGDRVALFAANGAEWSVVFFAGLRIGAILVPCNGWWSAEEMTHACTTVGPAVVICDERHAERVPVAMRQLPIARFTRCLNEAVEDTIAVEDPWASDADSHVDEDELGVILFTSGTTGFPRGVMLTHRSLIANVQNFLVVSGRLPHQLPDDHPPSVTLASLPLFHIGAIQLLLVPVASGSAIVFPEGRFDPAEVLRLVAEEGVTMWSAVPTMVGRVLATQTDDALDVSSLRTVVLGGAPVADALLQRLAARFPNAARGVGRAYGLSEAGGVVATGVTKELASRPGSSGRLMPTVEARIHGDDADGAGEILVRSPSVMEGYWGEHDATVDADGWLHTGDLGRLDGDGFLYITGRVKDLIIRGGENVAPAHIEARLLAHPAVAEAAVVGLPHPEWGEEVGAAVMVAAPGATTPDELSDHCRATLAHFEVPARWWLRTEPLPKNTSGKVLKHELIKEWTSSKGTGEP